MLFQESKWKSRIDEEKRMFLAIYLDISLKIVEIAKYTHYKQCGMLNCPILVYQIYL